jgi:hypothetical protein
MAAAAHAIQEKHEDRVELKKMIKQELKMATKYSEFNPDNYDQLQAFLNGLLAEIGNKYQKAADYYAEAARLSGQYSFGHLQAYFLECQLKCLHQLHVDEIILNQLKNQTIKLYENWGAIEKVNRLKRED